MGIGEESGENIVGTKDGVIKCRTIRRRAQRENRWDKEEFMQMRGLPWEPIPGGPPGEKKAPQIHHTGEA